MIRGLIYKIEPTLIRLYRRIILPPPPNLEGDRYIEYSWIAAHAPEGPGEALEFGCGRSYLALIAAQRGFEVTAIDLSPVDWPYAHPRLRFIQKDIFDLKFPLSSLDLIINCSAIEHVGLGRYGDSLDTNGDLGAMKLLGSLLKPGGIMLLTIPVGQDATFAPRHRVYGPERLPRLLDGYLVEHKVYWAKDGRNRWVIVDEDKALVRKPTPSVYSLGCFVLKARMATKKNG